MKKFLIIILGVCAVFAGLNSCKKTGAGVNPLTDIKNLGIGSYLVIDSTINPNLNVLNGTSTVGVLVHQYPLGETVDHIVLYATLGTSTDTTTWKLVKTVPYTAGSKVPLSATTTELATAFGTPASSFAPGSVFTFFPRAVTKSGKSYDINNAGDNGGGGLITGPAYASGFSFTVYVVCPFTGGMTGTYKVIKDDWVDWHAGDLVQVTDAGTNKIDLSKVYPGGGTIVNHLIVNVDPATGTATVPKVVFGYYSDPTSQYSAEGAGANDVAGYVFSCTGFITLNLTIDGDVYKLILQKQ